MTTEAGHVIGFKELYELIVGLDKKLDDRVNGHAVEQARLVVRVEQLEVSAVRRWQVASVWLGLVGSILCAFLAPMIVR